MRISTVTPVIIQTCMYDLIFHSSNTDESETGGESGLIRSERAEYGQGHTLGYRGGHRGGCYVAVHMDSVWSRYARYRSRYKAVGDRGLTCRLVHSVVYRLLLPCCILSGLSSALIGVHNNASQDCAQQLLAMPHECSYG